MIHKEVLMKSTNATQSFVAVLMALLVPLIGLAQNSPQLPHLLYGSATVGDVGTPVGTVIIAKVNGQEKGRITTTDQGTYGGPSANQNKLAVQGNIADLATIEFYISRIKASTTAAFESGRIQELALSWIFPAEITLEGDIANEPMVCVPGTNIVIHTGGLTLVIDCAAAAALTIRNVSNLGTGFFVGAPAPAGVNAISPAFEINISGGVTLTATMTYDDTGIDESTVRPYKHDGTSWVQLPESDVISRDTVANTITFKVASGATPYAPFGSPPTPPAPPAPSGGGGGGGGGFILPPPTPPAPAPTTTPEQVQVLGFEFTPDEIDAFVASEQRLVGIINKRLVTRLLGRILLQVEQNGEAWYLDPVSKLRYYLPNGDVAYQALRTFGLGITDANLEKIPVGIEKRFADVDSDNDGLSDKMEEGLGTNPANADTDGDGRTDGDEVANNLRPNGTGRMPISAAFTNRLKGRILLQVQQKGQAWYVNPADGKRYYLKDGAAAYQIMRFLSLGITDKNLRTIPIGVLPKGTP